MNELIVVTDQKAIEKIFLSDGLTQKIEAIKKDALNFVPDITTPTGRKACASKAYEIAKQKTVIDNAGKDLGAEYKLKIDKINAVRKAARDTLDQVKIDVRKPLTEWELEEEARIEVERKAVEMEIAKEEAIAENELFDRQREVERREAELKRQEEERVAKDLAEKEEKERIEREARIAQEAKEQAEKAAQEKIEIEKRAKIEAELKAKQDAEYAEQAKIEAAERAEREKKEAIAKAKLDEQERLAKIQREKEEKLRLQRVAEEKKSANVAHQKKVRVGSLKSFKEHGVDDAVAKNIVALIAGNLIKNITINY